jgi:hypothetical protein
LMSVMREAKDGRHAGRFPQYPKIPAISEDHKRHEPCEGAADASRFDLAPRPSSPQCAVAEERATDRTDRRQRPSHPMQVGFETIRVDVGVGGDLPACFFRHDVVLGAAFVSLRAVFGHATFEVQQLLAFNSLDVLQLM